MTVRPLHTTLAVRYRDEFPIFRQSVYLNSCSLGALSRRSRARVNTYLDQWETRGASAWYDTWWQALADLRAAYGRVIGAPAGTIALHPNISSALTSIAESLDYTRRPKVVVTSPRLPDDRVPVAGARCRRGRGRGAAEPRRHRRAARAVRARASTTARRWWRRATCSSPAGASRMPARSPRSRTGTGRWR